MESKKYVVEKFQCYNCGAPHDGLQCTYCGTMYKKRLTLGLQEPVKAAPRRKNNLLEFIAAVFIGLLFGFIIDRLKNSNPQKS